MGLSKLVNWYCNQGDLVIDKNKTNCWRISKNVLSNIPPSKYFPPFNVYSIYYILFTNIRLFYLSKKCFKKKENNTLFSKTYLLHSESKLLFVYLYFNF